MYFKKIIFGFFILLSSITLAQAKDSVRLTNGEWAPYMSENLKHNGLFSHLVTEAFALKGVNVEYGFFPWKRSFEIAEKGEWDGSVGWRYSDERAKNFWYSEPVIVTDESFFHLKSVDFDWNDFDDLTDRKIGATIGYMYGETFNRLEDENYIQVERVSDDVLNLRKLLHKRIEIFPINTDVGYDLINKNFPDQAHLFTHHSKPVKVGTFHLILSKKVAENEELVRIFNEGLKELKASGRFDQIVEASRNGEYLIN